MEKPNESTDSSNRAFLTFNTDHLPNGASSDSRHPYREDRTFDVSDLVPADAFPGWSEVTGNTGHYAVEGADQNSSPMSPSTPTCVDGAITPQPAGVSAAMSVNPTNRTNSMPDQHLSEFLLLLIHKMNLLAPPSELGVSFETDAAIDIRWDVKPQQEHGQTSRYTIQCSFRVGLLRDEEAIPFDDRSLSLPLFQSLCVSDSAADEVVDEIQFHEALIRLGFPVSGEDMELLDDQE